MTAVYGHVSEGALRYRALGWRPIPVSGKSYPVKGATGHAGVVTDDDIDDWSSDYCWRNLAVRHEGTVAVDVDQDYNGKNGVQHLASWAAGRGLPDLPPTWSSTARGPESGSRQYVYRVPRGLSLKSKPTTDVEVCQQSHRFTVCWPSTHPDTGARYTWYAPGAPGTPPSWGQACATPSVDSLPWLPREWAKALAVATPVQPGVLGGYETRDADALVASFSTAPPSFFVVEKLAEVADVSNHVGHDECKALLTQSLMLGLEGHGGVPELVAGILDRFTAYLESARPGAAQAEVRTLVAWCSRTAQIKHQVNQASWWAQMSSGGVTT